MSDLKKEKPACGGNHGAGLNTQNEPILPVIAILERIALALESQCGLMTEQNKYLHDIHRAIDQAIDR